MRYADNTKGKMSDYVTKQLRQLYADLVNRRTNVLNLEVIPCTRQPNGSGCGIFAAAVAFEWALGIKSLEVNFDHPRMRKHLIQCIQDEIVVPFPRKELIKRGRKAGVIKLSI